MCMTPLKYKGKALGGGCAVLRDGTITLPLIN